MTEEIKKVNVNLEVHSAVQVEYSPEIKTLNGKEYLVVPVVMMVEGVHNGSRGSVYHDPQELGKFIPAWNGIPVTISHPRNGAGEYVSANSPEVLSSWAVGYIFNARMEQEKLKAEAWLDIQRLAVISPETLSQVQKGEIIEVSVGVFSEEEEIEGNWNEEHYTIIARNYRPDHLALLPGETGACSVIDGCGVRVNSDSKVENVKLKKEVTMCDKCPEKVDELIANSATHFEETDREWLTALTEDKLDKLIPKRVRTIISDPKPVTVNEAKEVIQANMQGEELLKLLPEEMLARYNTGVKIYNDRRNSVIQSIMDNTEKDTWSKEDLESMKLDVLEKIEKSVKKSVEGVANYAGQAAGNASSGKPEIAPMPLPGVEFEN
jgi:hypothetical protein